MTIWDGYADWQEVAARPEIGDIKRSIIGNASGWRPNYCSPALAYILEFAAVEYREARGKEATAVDFGFGLGRNGPLLKSFFPNVVGIDLPEMVATYRSAEAEPLYAGLYTTTAELVDNQDLCLVYDSVVFQHIVDPAYVAALREPFNKASELRTFVTMNNAESANPILADLLKERHWRLWHTETETLSFPGRAHSVTIYRQW